LNVTDFLQQNISLP